MFTERALKQFKCEWSLTVIYIYKYIYICIYIYIYINRQNRQN